MRLAFMVCAPYPVARDLSFGSDGVGVPACDAPLLLRRGALHRGFERLLECLAAADCEPALAVGTLESDADDHGVRELPQALPCLSAEARNLCHRKHLLRSSRIERSVAEAC